jgi:uncharacterized protein YceH (UPF0502 family)
MYATRILVVIASLVTLAWPQQPMSSLDRERAKEMLKVIGEDVKKHYYDPKLHGVNWDAAVEDGKQKIEKEPSFNMALSQIAAMLDKLNDSHTFFPSAATCEPD